MQKPRRKENTMKKKIYENLEELLKEVKATKSLDTEIEFITHVQDLIGHSTTGELNSLSQKYKQTFYWVYNTAEGIESTLKFFTENSKFSTELREKLADAEADRDKYNGLYSLEKESLDSVTETLILRNAEIRKLETKLTEAEKEVSNLQEELIKLKAKLYDLTTA